jgi:hypothetical protein
MLRPGQFRFQLLVVSRAKLVQFTAQLPALWFVTHGRFESPVAKPYARPYMGDMKIESTALYNVYVVRQGRCQMAKETSVSVRVDDNMKKVLEALAHGQRRTLSSYLNILLEKHVVEQPKETILEAIANMQEQLQRESKIIDQVTLTTNLSVVPLPDRTNIGEPVRRHTVIPLEEPITAPEGPVRAFSVSPDSPSPSSLFSPQRTPAPAHKNKKKKVETR